jgi:hypothetical protein
MFRSCTVTVSLLALLFFPVAWFALDDSSALLVSSCIIPVVAYNYYSMANVL